MNDVLISAEKIIDSLNDGVYVCDRNRRIVYLWKGMGLPLHCMPCI
jgi:hypothetical protein